MDFVKRNLAFIAVVLGTLILLIGGVFLFSKQGGSPESKKVSGDLLIGKESYQTDSSASLTLVEFGDYQCPACALYSDLVEKLLVEFDGKLNFVFRNFPLAQHANGKISSYAVEAAGLQGKYWEMHNKVYATQASWSNSTDAKSIFVGYAKEFGLNIDKFNTDISSSKIAQKVQADYNDGITVGVDSTPTFYLDGVKISLAPDYDSFKSIVQKALDDAPLPQSSDSESYHIHFDLLSYVNGKPIDFSQNKYQQSIENPLNDNIHFHDGEGKVVHVHKENIDLSELFKSLNISFPENVEGLVNGSKNDNILAYVPKDLDRIVVGSGDASVVTDKACIYSLKCPDRGTPPPEECAGGLGTGCE